MPYEAGKASTALNNDVSSQTRCASLIKIEMFKKTVAAVFAISAVLSGCASNSGATFNIQPITTSSGQQAFRAECYGLFESGSACMKAVQSACGNQPYTVLQNVTGTRAPGDAREVVFMCGAPAQPAPAPAPAAQPAPPPAAAPVAPAPASTRKVTLDEKTNFAFDSAQLTPNARTILDRLIAEVRDVTFASVTVEGFTDAVGPAQYNVALSERRAQAVLGYPKSHGLQAQAFAMKGYGKARPVASNATSDGRAENRRVEILLKQ
ncbi:OmpA/MotB domain-containing protein [Caballeronia concitans]|uniref:OmpA/MotB domain-containing protein n=2 Tax=Caballeronia concitans TaxID=1777133 RepID=A0A658R2Z6_9BURK|nr:OmpA/MotB domain-containing protein [Caballeronia concitans]